MAQYRVLQKSFINDQIVEEGDIIEYDGEASVNLEPLDVDKSGKGKKAAAADNGEALV